MLDNDDATEMTKVSVVAVGVDVSEILYDLPRDDDDDDMVDRFTMACSRRPLPSVYYLQLDSDTK